MYIQAQASQTQAYTVYTKRNIPLDILVLQAQKNTDVHIYVTVGYFKVNCTIKHWKYIF